MKKAPWKDFNNEDIFEGSIISHHSGQQGEATGVNADELASYCKKFDE